MSGEKTIIDVVRSWMYAWLFSADNPIATQHGFRKVLNSLPNGSRILDVGVGSGIYFTNPEVVKLIKEKNLQIYAIDIDKGATDIAQERVVKNGLTEHVKCEGRDVLTLSEEKDGLFDVAIFFESFPVIPRKLFKTLVQHSSTVVKKGGSLILYHTLEPYPRFITGKVKPYLYYLTMCDFGLECTMEEMHQYCEDWGWGKNDRKLEPCLQTTYKDMWPPLYFIPGVRDWVITTYTSTLYQR
eukprot:m.1086952 g.1086952  ORF g.1086952 m.1086952 type:complete len:241 (-) comp24281_c0_seq2:4102-4824(-)